ncbi:glycosyltransferase [Microbacterium sp. KR10-403]|uniref:glycosyltransferase family 2 protein n=1 Tax=Microbacterium sp. KR10-403 TaxID=3158581 RepID=UPI0032E4CA3D
MTPPQLPSDLVRARIAIPTYKRPVLLERVLTEVLRQVAAINGDRTDAQVSVQVIDNDPRGSASSICEAHAVSYVIEPAPGIAAVRNRSLRDSVDQDVIIFIDDDEIPAQGWLEALIARFMESGADAVAGKVVTPFPDGVDKWLRVSGAFIRPKRADGQLINEAATNNLLLDLRTVRAHGLTFDERFGLTGGSDSLFTRQFSARGARIVWAEHALVMEQEDPARLTREWVLRRTYRLGNTKTRVNVVLADSPMARVRARARMMAHGVARIASGGLLIVWGRVTGSLSRRGHGERRAARGRGMVAGVFGHVHNEYGLRRAAEAHSDSE